MRDRAQDIPFHIPPHSSIVYYYAADIISFSRWPLRSIIWSCCVMLWHTVPCCVMLCHAMSRSLIGHSDRSSDHAVSCYVMLCHVLSLATPIDHLVMLCHAVSCCVIFSRWPLDRSSGHAVSCCVMLCHAMSCCLIGHSDRSSRLRRGGGHAVSRLVLPHTAQA